MKTSLLFPILPDEYKKSPGFANWKGKTIFEFIAYVQNLKKVPKLFSRAYDLCCNFIANNPELVDFTDLAASSMITDITKTSETMEWEFCPSNEGGQRPVLVELQEVLERLFDSMEKQAKNDSDYKRVGYLKDYFINNLSLEGMMVKNNVSTVESINYKMRNFSKKLLEPVKEKEFKFSNDYIIYLQQMREKYSFRALEDVAGELGIKVDPSLRMLNRFLKLDLLCFSDDIKIIVPVDTVTAIRRCLDSINLMLKDAFDYISVDSLLNLLPESLKKDEKEKLLDTFLHELDTIEFFEDAVRIETLFLEIIYIRQARIIFDYEKPITFSAIQEKYEAIYGTTITNLSAQKLNERGFACDGGNHWYYGKAQTLMQFIEEYVKDNGFLVKLSNLKEAINEKQFDVRDRTVEGYLGKICYRSKDDSDLFCHKDHLEEFPKFQKRKEMNRGQERKVVNALWDYLRGNPDGYELNGVKQWVLSFMKDQELNFRMSSPILNEYVGKGIFKVEEGKIRINPTYDESKLRFIGRGKNIAKYGDQIISIGVNELQKSPNHRMPFVDLEALIRDSIGDPMLQRNTIKILLDSAEEFKIEKEEGKRLFVSLAIEIEAEPIYEMIQANREAEPELIEIIENREVLAPNITFDWEKIISKLEKELAYYVREEWFGKDFNLREGLFLFRKALSNSENQNLSVRLPQDMYEYWFCATTHYDRNRYFSDLAICYESLLRDLYPYEMGETHGIEEVLTFFPAIKDLGERPKEDRLANSFRDLKYHRKRVAHGAYVDLTSRQEAEKIINYIALYVYTIATKGEVYRS